MRVQPGGAEIRQLWELLHGLRIMNVSFQKILVMMNGGNQSVADVISTYVYRRGIQDADFSYATGVNLFQSLVSLVFVVATNTISRKFSETSLW